MSSRQWKWGAVGLASVSLVLVGAATMAAGPSAYPDVVVYKNPGCQCCDAWADHLREAGFQVEIDSATGLSGVFAEHGIPVNQQSCHLATIGDRIAVGHVPVAEVMRLLDLDDGAVGLTVPGMPLGSPGMEVGATEDEYDVLLIDSDRSVSRFARYEGLDRID